MTDHHTFRGQAGKQAGAPLSTVIKRMIWLCMLPLFLFASGMAIYQIGLVHRQQSQQAELLAENLILSTDNALDARIHALSMLAMSPLVDDLSRWHELYCEAQGFYKSFGTHVVISDGRTPAQLLLNTRVPFGTKLPVVQKPNGRLAGPIAMRTGRPAVSDLFAGPVAHEPLVGIAVPVLRDGKAKYAIVTTIDRPFFQNHIDQTALPPGWSLVLKDARGETIAGRPQHVMKHPAARFVVNSQVSRWTAMVEIPSSSLWQPLILAAVGLGMILLSVTLAGFLGGKWAGRRLGMAVASLAQTPAPGSPPPDILEVAAARHLIDEEAQRRMLSEAERQRIAQQRQLALDAAHMGWWHYDPITRIASWDDRYKEIFGVSGYTRPNDEILTRLHPDDLPGVWAKVEAALNPDDPQPYSAEYRIHLPDGSMKWIEAYGIASFEGVDGDGRATSFVGTVADITERKRSEQALKESEQMYRTIGDAIPYGVWVTDSAGYCKYISPSFLEMVGMTMDQIQQFGWLHLLPPEDVEPTKDHWLDCVQTGREFSREHRFRSADGSYRDVLAIGRPVRDGKGKIVNWVGLNLDITDRKKMENALRESEQRFRLALRNAPVSVAAQDRELRYTWAYNQHTARPEEIVGHFDRDLFTHEEAAHVTAIKKRVLKDNIELREQMWFKRPGGRIFLDVCWEPIRDPSGQVIGVASATVDLTTTKLAEEALKASLDEKEVLLKEIHHRVKNNMQVISSLVDLQADEIQDAAMRDIFQEVNYRVRSMAMVHEKLYQSTDLARVEFADYARSLLGYLWRAIGGGSSDVQLNLDLKPLFLPVNAAVPCGLILNELFTNALKHAFKGRSNGEVTVSLREDAQGKVCLRVCDDGVGLPPEADWPQSSSLGLRIVKTLARQLHAAVEVISDEGTQFAIIFERPDV